MKYILAGAAVALMPIAASAATIITSYGTVTGSNDANQAGPMWGQGITVNNGADTIDASIPDTVYLEQISFQRTSSTTGTGSNVAYIHVYDAFAVGGSGNPTTIGNLVAVSTTTVDLGTVGANETMTWSFNGEAISKSSGYIYVLATDTNAATPSDFSNLTTTGFELNTGNPYSGGDAYRANSGDTSWDMEFELITNTDPIPEPSTAALGCVGLLALLRRKRG